MYLDARTLDDYLDEWLRGLSATHKKELAALIHASGGDESVLERIPTRGDSKARMPPQGESS